MSKLIWDAEGQHYYETGVDQGVLYKKDASGYGAGVAWNGLISVSENPSGADANKFFADNIKYLELTSVEEFGASIECYTYPDEFAECDGSAELVSGVMIGQQSRKAFGFAYRTKVGNDVTEDLGYKYHLVYGAKATPASKAYNTINDSPEAITFSYTITTTPVDVTGYKKTAHLEIDTTKLAEGKATALAKFLAILYGADEYDSTKKYAVGDVVAHDGKTYECKTAITTPTAWSASSWTEIGTTDGPRLPMPDEVAAIFA